MSDNISKLKKEIEFYDKKYKVSDDEIPNFEYYIANDMIEIFKKFAETEEQLAQLKNYPETIKGINGTIVFTKDNRNFIIIINKNQFNNNKDYIHTILHEYTHVLDYHKYMKENNISNFDILIKSKYGDAFHLWTEYHARVIGTINYYECYLLKKLNIKKNKFAIKQFINSQVQPHIEQLLSELSEFEENKKNPMLSAKGTFSGIMYNITQHFGRFSVFGSFGVDVLQNSKFPINELYRLFGDKIIDYYKILKELNYNKENFNLENLQNIIDDIYKYTWEH